MPLDSDKLERWISKFYGYGSWDAPIWFIGYEEGGGSDFKEIEQKINFFDGKRSNIGGLCNLRKLHKCVETNLNGYDNYDEQFFGKDPKRQATWHRLNEFLNGYHNQENSFKETNPFRNTALIELFPLPNPGVKSWNYKKKSWVRHNRFKSKNIFWLKSRRVYESYLIEQRSKKISSKINSKERKEKLQIVLCYKSLTKGKFQHIFKTF